LCFGVFIILFIIIYYIFLTSVWVYKFNIVKYRATV